MADFVFYTLIVLMVGAWVTGIVAGLFIFFNRNESDHASKFWFDPLVWLSQKRAARYLTERGLRYWRISLASAFVVLGLGLLLVLVFMITGGPS